MSRPRKRAPGRPALPKGKARGAVLSIRLTYAERAQVQSKADADGISASNWARETLVGILMGSG